MTNISVYFKNLLSRSNFFFIVWSVIAAFGTYFSMYAFRKPFTAGVYADNTINGIHFKTILVIAQVIGYMVSKFAGIKIISELKSKSREKLIIGLVLFAECSLLLFGIIPAPYNFFCLFLNGLPLGMVWGIVFSYLEGRKFTEVLGIGLSISLIVSSGFLKSIYFLLKQSLPFLSEFWLPAAVGMFFLPIFLFFTWMLSIIPPPTAADKLLRKERLPMSKSDKHQVFVNYSLGIICFAVIYLLLATMRDFRDNFAVEIWNEIEPGWNKSIFSLTETVSGLVVLIAIGCLSLVKNNAKGFLVTQAMIVTGLLVSGGSSYFFSLHLISPFYWMLFTGMGMFLAYTPIQVALFDRMIALYSIKANAGFFVYICDSLGYLGSVVLLLYKEFFIKDLSWASILMKFSYGLTMVGVFFSVIAFFFFMRKRKENIS